MALEPDNYRRTHYRDGGIGANPFDGYGFTGNDDSTDFGAPGGVPLPPTPPGAVPPVVPGAGGGGNGNGGNGGGGALNYGGLSLRPTFNFRDAPVFRPPVFRAPTFAEAQQEPGYQFRLDGGRNALEGSAAARGTLRTGGTLKDITEYGQNFASQEYGNVYNRALQGFDRTYRGEYDAFQPRMQEWAFLSGAEKDAAMAQFAREMQVRQLNNQGGGGGNQPDPPPPPPPPDPGHPYPTQWWKKGKNQNVNDYEEWLRLNRPPAPVQT